MQIRKMEADDYDEVYDLWINTPGVGLNMAVRVSARRQGVGRALVRCAMNALAQEGIQKVAFVVFTDNTGGNEFWEKCGFSVRGDLHYRNQYISKVLDTLTP